MFSFCFLCFWCEMKQFITKTNVKKLPFKCYFRVLWFGIMFKSLDHFQLNFCVLCKIEIHFFSFAQCCPVLPIALKKLSFPHCVLLVPLSKISCLYKHLFISGLSNSVLLINVSVFMPMPYFLNFYSFEI